MPSPIDVALQLLLHAAGFVIWPTPLESASTSRTLPFTFRNAMESVCLLSELLPITTFGSPTPTFGWAMRMMFGVRWKPTYSEPVIGSRATAVGWLPPRPSVGRKTISESMVSVVWLKCRRCTPWLPSADESGT